PDGLRRHYKWVSRTAIVWRQLALAACALASFLGTPRAAAQMSVPGANHVMIVGTKVAPPFAMKSDDGSWSGISIELWRRIATDLHLSYRFEEVSLDELINGTAGHRLDAAIAAITVTATRAESVDFTQPYYATSLGITVRRVSVFNWLNLTESLFSLSLLKMLLLLVAAAILMGFVVWLIERRHTEHFGGGVKQGLGSSLLWSARILTQAMPEKGPTTLPGRVIAVIWLAVAVTSIAVFTASLTTYFTTRQLEGYVRGVQDLHSVRVGTVAGTSAVDYLRDQRITFRAFPNAEAGLRAVKDGNTDAFVYDKPLMSWLVQSHYADSLQVLDAVFDQQNYAIALSVGSPLRMPLEHAMLRILATQWWRDTTSGYLGTD
ncbi:MAG TPA: transporter substrate-binding domain-containing protein, partial [Dongiaceae bacterium]|nr:transporter substrate-binding domain-containing protein [Dongiaceae bacterium]